MQPAIIHFLWKKTNTDVGTGDVAKGKPLTELIEIAKDPWKKWGVIMPEKGSIF